jgi:hypothetical protein
MITRLRIIPAVFVLSAVCSLIEAGQPTYLIPRTTPAVIPQASVAHAKPATGQVLEAQPYAYGWFGVQPRRHWTRHFGYYRNYTEWSAK